MGIAVGEGQRYHSDVVRGSWNPAHTDRAQDPAPKSARALGTTNSGTEMDTGAGLRTGYRADEPRATNHLQRRTSRNALERE